MTEKGQSLDIESSEDLIRDLVKKRGVVKRKFTLFLKYVQSLDESNLTATQKLELEERYQRDKILFDTFSEIQDEIDVAVSECQLDKELQEREAFQDQYYAIVAKCKCVLKDSSSQSVQSQAQSQSRINGVKLPTISLPTFDGSYDQWLEFRDTYMSIIHNSNNLENVQKFHYLRSVLTGNALQVIKSLEFSADNYLVAWGLLENRYNNNRLLVHNHVKAIFSAQSMSKESAAQIRKLIDTMLRNIRALKTLGEPTDTWDTLIIHIIVSKLDSSTEREWELHKSNSTNSSVDKKMLLSDLLTFLKDRADFLETVKPSQNKPATIDNNNNTHTKKSLSVKSHSYVATQKDSKRSNNSKRYKCNMCGSNHPIYSCEEFLNLSLRDKLRIIEEKGLCVNCLRIGHAVNECWFGPCKHCNKKHNTLIHDHSVNTCTSSAVAHITQKSHPEPSTSDAHTQLAHTTSHKTHTLYTEDNNINTHYYQNPVLLSTALVEVADEHNVYHTARALLDNGSQHCFIAETLCKKLNIPLIQSTVQVRGVGNTVTQSTNSCSIQLRSKVNSFNTRFNCLVLSCISSHLPTLSTKGDIEIPDNIQLADPEFCSSGEIHLLIGADRFWDLLSEGLVRLPNGPYLQNTKFGWIISGIVHKRVSRIKQTQCNFTHSTLDSDLKRFWELEEIPISSNKFTKEEIACEKLFKDTTLRVDKGRFSVRIPLSESADVLGDTFTMAENRFLALERKLLRSAPAYRKMYIDFINEYLSLGHMSRISDYNKICYFLPHHGVYREHSSTTKLRVVFDGSAKSTSGKSLNDIQHTGPALHNDLFSILLRFRQFRYVASSDIEKMFRQVKIQEDQRNLQLILWRENPSDPLGVYQLNTVTYGTASAPYLSMRCLKQLALECNDDVIAQVINDDIFVDDLVTGHDDQETLLEICNSVSKVLESGCFHLRKWVFNSPVTQSNVSAFKDLSFGENCHTKTLGMGWFYSSDELYFDTKYNQDKSHVTKRIILSTIAQTYDPLGLLAPTVITAKIILQKLWLAKLDWDEPVPKSILSDWQNFINKIPNLQYIHIPRHVIGQNTSVIELHIFCDASQCAYGACAYIRSVTDNNIITVHLLCAKSRVAPVKPVSIPRLELCGALVGARLFKKIEKSLRLNFDNVYFWSDSTVVLGWLKMSPNLLKPFVQNRIVEINELTGDKQWFHVAGKQNPADMLSRGMHLDLLKSCDMWWHGPAFLQVDNSEWDQNMRCYDINCDELPELKPVKSTALVQINSDDFLFHRFSSFNRLRRVVAYILRFTHNIRKLKAGAQRFTGCLSVNELNNATRVLTQIAQQQSFPEIYDSLKNKRQFKCSRSISGLNIFMDEHNLIRVGGRLVNSDSFTYDKKHPLLLCSRHLFTRLIFEHQHKVLLHAGPQLLLATVRETWWPLKGRNLAKQVVHKCVRCTRMRATPMKIQMGNLPNERLVPGYPFLRCGVDYAGPLLMLNRAGRGAKLTKCYICLFVCFATRAIHLELVTSLTSEAYLLALKRFISRRGKPMQIFSDNGKTFVGALKEFSKFLDTNESDILNYTSDNSIEFSFIPPYSPHFGGLWEAGVKSCKYHLRRIVGNAHLTYEELSTVLAQIEAVLNSRPISPMSTDPTDLLPLSPAHFLIGRPLTAPADKKDLTMTATHRLPRYDRIEQMRQNFWRRWATEYISELQKRTKWQSNQDTLLPNTLVLIKEDHLPPLKWQLGRVQETFPGRDGLSRVAVIKTATGIIKRTYPKLCPLLQPQ